MIQLGKLATRYRTADLGDSDEGCHAIDLEVEEDGVVINRTDPVAEQLERHRAEEP